jgi:hypothetical protein
VALPRNTITPHEHTCARTRTDKTKRMSYNMQRKRHAQAEESNKQAARQRAKPLRAYTSITTQLQPHSGPNQRTYYIKDGRQRPGGQTVSKATHISKKVGRHAAGLFFPFPRDFLVVLAPRDTDGSSHKMGPARVVPQTGRPDAEHVDI